MRDLPDGRARSAGAVRGGRTARLHPGRSRLPRRSGSDRRLGPRGELVPRDRNRSDRHPPRRRRRGRPHGRLVPAGLGGAHGRGGPRRRPSPDATRVRIDVGRPRPRGPAAGPLRPLDAVVAPYRGGRGRGRVRDDVRPRMDRRPPGDPTHRGTGDGDARGNGPGALRHRCSDPAESGRDHRGEGRGVGGDGRVQTRVPAVGAHRRRSRLQRRLQHARSPGHHHARRAGHRVQRTGDQGDRDELRWQRSRSGEPGQPHHRTGAPTRRAELRRRAPRRSRPRRARQPGQAQLLFRRGRRHVAIRHDWPPSTASSRASTHSRSSPGRGPRGSSINCRASPSNSRRRWRCACRRFSTRS